MLLLVMLVWVVVFFIGGCVDGVGAGGNAGSDGVDYGDVGVHSCVDVGYVGGDVVVGADVVVCMVLLWL